MKHTWIPPLVTMRQEVNSSRRITSCHPHPKLQGAVAYSLMYSYQHSLHELCVTSFASQVSFSSDSLGQDDAFYNNDSAMRIVVWLS